ncbi:MAG: OadG family protein [Verrucomicrobia bacterium]|nr:OadG family protein [Verrucomicrobiota bacterium]MCH8512173.1 OadG family protein [Kiritimatiellia bacterium]
MKELWHNITSNQGLELAAAGILLVFAVLILVSLCISVLPKLLAWVGPMLDRKTQEDEEDTLDFELAAAAAAMHEHLNRTGK